MITMEQALNAQEFHTQGCKRTVGPRGGVTVRVERVRRNGRTQTWKRQPDRFSIPVKYGLYTYGRIDNEQASCYHAAEDCPL